MDVSFVTTRRSTPTYEYYPEYDVKSKFKAKELSGEDKIEN